MEQCFSHNKEFDFDNAGLDDAEEEWTEPLVLNPGKQNCSEIMINEKIPVSKIGHSRTIIHFDVDCFYAQVEMLRNPELRNKPLGIQQKNIVVTTNYIARNYGVPKSTYVTDAKKICPELVLVCGEDLTNYRQMSYRISEFMQKYSLCVERLGFDENFIDVSELVTSRLKDGKYKIKFIGHVYCSNQEGIKRPLCDCGCEIRLQIGSQIAADIREALNKELGITCCAGVGHNKLLAKLVAGTHKPNQQTSVLPHMAMELMSSLSSVLCIPGIGFSTSRRLNALGISSVLDLQASDKKMLEKEFGAPMVQMMVQLSYGVDDSPVIAYSQPQTLSDEDSFKCCNDIVDAERKIRDLVTSLMKRVVEDGRVPQTVRLTVRRVSHKYHRESKQCPVPANMFTKCLQSCDTEAVVERLIPLLMKLFRKLVDPFQPFHLTLIAVCFAKLVKPADELGSIGTFFTRNASSQHGDNNLGLSESMDNQYEIECQPISKFSPLKSELNVKRESNTKTLKHFFSVGNNETQPFTEQNLSKVDGITSANVLLPADDVNEKSVNRGSIKSHTFSSLHGSEGCTTDSNQGSAVIKTAENRQAEGSSRFPDRCCTHIEEESLKEKCLQDLLPADVDAHTITELPVDIQKEVLLQYGIYIEDFPQRRFTLMSDNIRTRSQHSSSVETVKIKKSLHSPRKRKTPKRNPDSEAAVKISKRKRMLCTDGVPDTNPEICQQLNVTDNTVGENSIEISSETLNTLCAKDESLPCVKDTENKQGSENYIFPSTGYSTAVENFRKSDTDESASCTDNTSRFSSQLAGTKFCTQQDHHAGKPVVNCDLDTCHEDLQLEYSSHKMPDHQGVSLDTSMISLSSPQVSVLSCRSSQRNIYHNKLPSNIDSEMFLSLPSNIRGEIMAHIAMGSSDSVSGQYTRNEITESQKNLKQTKALKHKTQNTLLTYFKRNDTTEN